MRREALCLHHQLSSPGTTQLSEVGPSGTAPQRVTRIRGTAQSRMTKKGKLPVQTRHSPQECYVWDAHADLDKVVPPDNTTLAHNALWTSTLHFVVRWQQAPHDLFPVGGDLLEWTSRVTTAAASNSRLTGLLSNCVCRKTFPKAWVGGKIVLEVRMRMRGRTSTNSCFSFTNTSGRFGRTVFPSTETANSVAETRNAQRPQSQVVSRHEDRNHIWATK